MSNGSASADGGGVVADDNEGHSDVEVECHPNMVRGLPYSEGQERHLANDTLVCIVPPSTISIRLRTTIKAAQVYPATSPASGQD